MSQEVRAAALALELGTVNLRVLTVATPKPALGYSFTQEPGEVQPSSPDTTRTPFRTSDSKRLIVTDAGTGAPILEPMNRTMAGPWSLQLPAGRYRLRPWRSSYGVDSYRSNPLPIPLTGDDWR